MMLNDIFEIEYGQGEYNDKSHFVEFSKGIPIISSKGDNNGIYGFYEIVPFYKNIISVARVGTICSAFYHDYDCCIDDNCLVLKPKQDFTKQEMLYFTMLIRQEKYRYLYGRQVTPKRLQETKIPDRIPDYINKTQIAVLSNKPLIIEDIELNIPNWQYFNLINQNNNGLFNFTVGGDRDKIENKLIRTDNTADTVFVVSNTATNNGISEIITGAKFDNSNTITLATRGNDFKSFYQEKDIIPIVRVINLHPVNFSLNKYIAMFLCTVFEQNMYKYSYGRVLSGENIIYEKIKLPSIAQGQPDWQFMENYIKSLPYSSSL